VSAGTSFALFALGAIVPVVPFLFLVGAPAIVVSAVLSSLALFAVGAAITVFTGRGLIRSGLRQVAFGLAAAAITFGIGSALGTVVN
jgi:VIT1/CCC1 family predicted Fe2+/Mn2+ transporter